MSKITLPTFTEGTVADADTVYGAFYDVGGDSLEVINGRRSSHDNTTQG